MRALLRVFLNTSSNLFLNSINKKYSTSYLFGYALANQIPSVFYWEGGVGVFFPISHTSVAVTPQTSGLPPNLPIGEGKLRVAPYLNFLME